MEISNLLHPPDRCDVCNSVRTRFVEGNEQGPSRYLCLACRASVNCHEGTGIPMGYMANAHTRYLRAKAHEAFDPIWMHGLMSRTAAYKWATRQVNDTVSLAHISRLSDVDLEQLITKSIRHYRKLSAKAKTKAQRKEDEQLAEIRQQHRRVRRNGGRWRRGPTSSSG